MTLVTTRLRLAESAHELRLNRSDVDRHHTFDRQKEEKKELNSVQKPVNSMN